MTTNATKTVCRRIAAEMIGIAPATLKKWAIEERGPAVHAKLGDRQQSRTLYAVAEIERWRSDPVGYEERRYGGHHANRGSR
jgi:hypothetical protein